MGLGALRRERPFPIGAFGFSVASDALHTCFGQRRFSDAATQALGFGLISSALAVPFGAIDWLAIPKGTRAKRIGLWHAVGNVAMLGLFGASRWLRLRERTDPSAEWLSGTAFALSGVTAWLGGELVDRHAIGVHEGAHPDLLPANGRRNEGRMGEAVPSSYSDDAPTLPGIYPAKPYPPQVPS